MSLFLGYYRPTATFRQNNEARAIQGEPIPDPKFIQMVVDLPLRLPAGCTIVGSYGPSGGSPELPPAVMILETSDPAHLGFITNYYSGYLHFQWFPATTVGADKNQREQWRQSVETPAQAVR